MKRLHNLVCSKKSISLILLFAGFALVSTDLMTAHANSKSSDVPPVGQDWIKVKLPLEMSYRSTSDSNHKDISSDQYKVENLSDYPVAVNYTGFVGKDGSSNPITTGVQNLNLVLSDGYKFLLVENGKATDCAKTKLYELGARSGTPVSGNFNKPSSEVIRFSGSTQSNIDSSRLIIEDNQLNFELSLLDPNGQIPKDQTSIKVKDSEITLGSSWNSNDNYVDGTDDMGKPLDINKVTIGGDKVDTNKPGVYKVTYSYRNITQTANVTVKDLTSIKVHDSMVNVGESWKALDNFDSATNEYGQPIDIGKITVDGSDIDTNAPGTYNANYSYHNVIQTAKVVVNGNITFMNQAWDIIKGPNKMGDGNYLVASQQSLGDKDFASRDYYYSSDIATTDGYQDSDAKSVVDQWYNDNIKGTVYENYIQPVMLLNPTLGDMINLGWVNNSDGHSATGLLTINQPDAYPTKIDYTKGNRQAFLMSGSDVSDGKGEFGNLTPAALSHEKVLISKNLNNFWLRTPGEYFNLAGRVRSDKQTLWDNLVSDNNEIVPSLVIHIGNDYIQVKDSTIDPKSVWKPSDNFINATDESGNKLPFTKVTVGGDKVDTNTPGTYNVTYSYGNALQTAKIIVKDLTGIKVHDSTINIGEEWKASDNFDNCTDEYGQPLDFSKIIVGGDNVDPEIPGIYKVTYSYGNISKTATVKVSSELNFMNQMWDIIKGPNKMGTGNYLISSQQSIKSSQFAERKYYYGENVDTLDGYQDNSLVKSLVDQWYNSNIKGSVYENNVQPVVLSNPTLGDMKKLGWKSNTTGIGSDILKTINLPDSYPTKIDKTNGTQQAFLMSGSDVSDGQGKYGSLTPAALAHRDTLISKNFNDFWLRTPGEHTDLAGRIMSDRTSLWDNYLSGSNEVIPSLVIHIP